MDIDLRRTTIYTIIVSNCLIEWDYSTLVEEFHPMDVAASIGQCIGMCQRDGYSPRHCALLIWAETMNLLMERSRKATVH